MKNVRSNSPGCIKLSLFSETQNDALMHHREGLRILTRDLLMNMNAFISGNIIMHAVCQSREGPIIKTKPPA